MTHDKLSSLIFQTLAIQTLQAAYLFSCGLVTDLYIIYKKYTISDFVRDRTTRSWTYFILITF